MSLDDNFPRRSWFRWRTVFFLLVAMIGFSTVFVWNRNQRENFNRGLRTAEIDPQAAGALVRKAGELGYASTVDVSAALAWIAALQRDLSGVDTNMKSVEASKCRSDLLLKLSSQLLRLDRIQDAIALLEELRKRNTSDSDEAQKLLWKAYFSLGIQDEAFELAKERIAIHPDDLPFRLDFIRGLKSAYREAECLEEIRTARSLPFSVADRRELDLLLLDQLIVVGEVSEAWMQLDYVRKQYGNPIQLQFKVVDLYRTEGKLDEAMKLIDELFPHVPRMPVVFLTRGAIELDLGRYPDAIADLEQAVSLEPFDEKSQFKLSEAYRRSGDEKRASIHREIGIGIRQKQIRINLLLKQLTKSRQPDKDCDELARLHRELGKLDTSRYWQQQAGKNRRR